MARTSRKTPITIGKSKFNIKYKSRAQLWTTTKTTINLSKSRFLPQVSTLTNLINQDLHEPESPHCMDFDEDHTIPEEIENLPEQFTNNDDCIKDNHGIPNNLNNIFKDPNYKNIFPGSNLSVNESSLLIVSFVLRHSLTGEAKKDLVNLIRLLIPIQNTLPKYSISIEFIPSA